MYLGPLTADSADAVRAAESAIDRHCWPWWAFGFKPGRRKPWRGTIRRHDIAHTIAPEVEKCVRAGVAKSLATLDDPAWADAIRAAIELVSAGGKWEPEPGRETAAQAAGTLPPLSGEVSACAKCGRHGAMSTAFGAGPIRRGGPRIEVQRRTCPNCGYTWLERCADAKPPEESVSDDTDVPTEGGGR